MRGQDAPAATPAPPAGAAIPASGGEEADWRAVEDARSGTGFARALDRVLQDHPHGPLASRALLEQAALQDDLTEAAALLRRAAGEGAAAVEGSAATLALARLEFAEDKPDLALKALEDAEAWPRAATLQPEWLYWRGQCRMTLKGFQGAADDFRLLLSGYPGHARAAAAALDVADCEAALRQDAQAAQDYAKVAASGGPFAAQALWGMGCLRQRQGKPQEALEDFERLVSVFPDSFEAQAAVPRIQELRPKAAPAGAPPPAQARPGRALWYVHVGAYGKRRPADRQARHLRRDHFRVSVRLTRVRGRLYYIVKVGPFNARAKAEAMAQILHERERIVTVQVGEE
jgi:tetratricopeptide (TPR) repeat protein